jgi:hypothetical protein
MEVLMRSIAFIISISILFIISCAGNKAEVIRHRKFAEESFRSAAFQSAKAHVDSAAAICEDIPCKTAQYRWLLNISTTSGNDVLRAEAYEKLILAFLDSSAPAKRKVEYEDSARTVAGHYLSWSDTLHALRGDPLPLASALLLCAEIAPPDSPNVAIKHLQRIVAHPESATIPHSLKPYMFRAQALLDEIGREMALRYRAAKLLSENFMQFPLEDLEFVYLAASGFYNVELAAEVALLIAEHHRDHGNQIEASRWAGEALLWESRK